MDRIRDIPQSADIQAQARELALRGGSWNNNLKNARLSARNNDHPNNQWNNNGMRVLLALHRLVSLPVVRADQGQAPRQNWLACRLAELQ